MRLNDTIVEQHSPDEPRRTSLYWHHVYEVVTRALDFLAYDVARWLNSKGYRAFPVPGSTPYDFDKLKGIFSHKLAAHLAGIGWIGKSCLLLTDRFGPRARFVSVLTGAPLETGTSLDRPCGKCHVCVDACPVKAFTGKDFCPEDGREVRFDVFKCSEYRKDHPCGLCVSACPKGSPPHVQRKA
jgi:epoxyqueuosine reductase QueG